MFLRHKRKIFFLGLLALLFSLFSFTGETLPVRAQENFTPTFTATNTPESTAFFTETPEGVESSPTPTASNTPEAPSTATNISEAPLEIKEINGDYVDGEILVRFVPQTGGAQAATNACFVNEQVKITNELDAISASLLIIENISVAEAIALAERCPNILFAEPNYRLYATDTIPNDPSWGSQYGLNNIRAPQGWDTTTGSAAVVIAIVDTGVDLTHPDLSAKIVAGYDFVNSDAIAQDDNGHGSHVAGIAAASSNNGAGVAGASWGARIMPVKVLNANKNGSFANAAAGIIWAADHGAHIINLSLGGSSHSTVFQNAIDYAYSKGVTIVAASGNNSNGFVLYPARYSNVIAVGATDSVNNRASFSNYGAELDIVAPGVSIYSTGISTYFTDSGTSMSTPYVAGLAAILRGIPGSGSPANLAWAMKSTALDLGIAGRDDYYGSGLIQMDAAIQLLWVTPTSTMPSISTVPPPSTGQTGFWLDSASPTMMPTSTSTAIVTPSPYITPSTTATLSEGATPEPELLGLSMATPTQITKNIDVAEEDGNKKMPTLLCAGSSFISLGILLFFFGFRLRKKKGRLL